MDKSNKGLREESLKDKDSKPQEDLKDNAIDIIKGNFDTTKEELSNIDQRNLDTEDKPKSKKYRWHRGKKYYDVE